MAETTFGLGNTNRPAPLWYRRLTNAMILFFIPAYVGVVQVLPMSDAKRNLWMCAASAIPFIMKGVGTMLGNGQYVDENKTQP